MSKVVFFITPMHGHVNPTLGLVRELTARGEEVIYFTTAEFRAKVTAAGASCRPYKETTHQYKSVPENPNAGFEEKLQQAFTRLATHMNLLKEKEQELYSQLTTEKPDYVVYDYINAFWGKVLAQKAGIPAIATIPSFALCEKLLDADPAGCLRYLLHISPKHDYFRGPNDIKELFEFISSRARDLYGLPHFNLLNFANSDTLNIVFTSRHFQPHGDLFDDTFRFIGPSLEHRDDDRDETATEIRRAIEGDPQPLIYISTGSMLGRGADFYNTCIDALKDMDRRLVISHGDGMDPAQLKSPPANALIHPFVPQLDVLRRAGLFITHGGMNSVTEGIYHNVPLIVLPMAGDQFSVAARVEELGAGICLDPGAITPTQIRDAATELLNNPKYHENINKIKKSFDQSGGVKQGADEIFSKFHSTP